MSGDGEVSANVGYILSCLCSHSGQVLFDVVFGGGDPPFDVFDIGVGHDGFQWVLEDDCLCVGTKLVPDGVQANNSLMLVALYLFGAVVVVHVA